MTAVFGHCAVLQRSCWKLLGRWRLGGNRNRHSNGWSVCTSRWASTLHSPGGTGNSTELGELPGSQTIHLVRAGTLAGCITEVSDRLLTRMLSTRSIARI